MSMNRGSSMDLLTLWPWPSNFEPQKACHFEYIQAHALYQVWTLWDGIIRFWVMMRTIRQTNKQTDTYTHKQTDSKILPTQTDTVSMAKEHSTASSTGAHTFSERPDGHHRNIEKKTRWEKDIDRKVEELFRHNYHKIEKAVQKQSGKCDSVALIVQQWILQTPT